MSVGRYLALVIPLLLGAALVAFGPQLLRGQTWLDVPFHTQLAPAWLAAGDSVSAGAAPWWWPHLGLGLPLERVAEWCAWYVPLWWCDSTADLEVVLIAHLVWFGLGTALWLRARGADELVSALVGSALVLAAPWLQLGRGGGLFAVAHVPWLLVVAQAWASSAPWRLLAAAAPLWAAIVASGQLRFAALFGGCWLVWLVVESRARPRAMLAGAAALGLAAAMTAIMWSSAATRGAWPSSLAWPDAASWLRSLLFLAPAFVFAPTLLRKRPALAVLLLPTMAMAAWLYRAGPTGEFAVWMSAAALLLATQWTDDEAFADAWSGYELLLTGVLLTVLTLWVGPPRVGVVMLVLTFALAAVRRWKESSATWTSLLPAVALVVCAQASRASEPTLPRSVVAEAPALAPARHGALHQPTRVLRPSRLYEDTPPSEVAMRRAWHTLEVAAGARFGVANVSAGAAWSLPLGAAIHAAAHDMPRFWERYGIEHALVPASTVVPTGMPAQATYQRWSLVATPSRPRAFATTRVRMTAGDNVLAALFAQGLREAEALVEPDALGLLAGLRFRLQPPRTDGARFAGRCELRDATPLKVELECLSATNTDALVVLLDAWDPWWHATVDGVPSPVHRVDALIRGVWLPRPSAPEARALAPRRVVFSYQPPHARVAWTVSLGGLLLWLALAALAAVTARRR